MEYFHKLKNASPALYHICLLVLGVSSALAIYKSIGVDGSYGEVLGFVAFGILLYCIVILVDFHMKGEIRKIVFSAAIVTIAAGLYVTDNINSTFFKIQSPTAKVQSTWCNLTPYFCQTITVGDKPNPDANVPRAKGTKPIGKNIVYFQYAGKLNRENDIKPFLKKLLEEDWNGQGFDKGGAREKAAKGLNVVRYFHSEDKGNAERLVNAIKISNPPNDSGKGLGIQFLEAQSFGNPKIGLLEIWISN